MLQTTKPTRRKAKKAPAPGCLDPATIKERFYGLTLTGDCLEPEFMDGDKLVIDREGPLHAGCYAVFYHRPECVPHGKLGLTIKRLVTAIPPHLTFPYREHPDSEVHHIVAVQMLNPPKQWVIRCDKLLAVHHCVGRADDPEVQAKLATEGWRM